ncbi:MAG: hypothetical protein K0U34_07820, partial [Alphaproteobacteria bacterium]|nr:hypothetical protein [Alphaproteobacteria bacterium]
MPAHHIFLQRLEGVRTFVLCAAIARSEIDVEVSVTTDNNDDDTDEGRRDFMVLAASTFAGIGAAVSID